MRSRPARGSRRLAASSAVVASVAAMVAFSPVTGAQESTTTY